MSHMIHRTLRNSQGHLIEVSRANTPLHPSAIWIKNPDLSSVDGSPAKYWKTSGDLVVLMDAGEQDAADAALALTAEASVRRTIMRRTVSTLPLEGFEWDVQTSGRTFFVDILEAGVIDDATIVVADPALELTFKVCYVLDQQTEALSVEVFEKAEGFEYPALAENEVVVGDFGEWTLAASGTDLVQV